MNIHEEHWEIVFVSETEKYGLAARVNGCLQLMCRGMVLGAAQRIAAALNGRHQETKRELAYERE